MADVFLSTNVTKVLENKYVVIMGDSVQRSIYKDLVCILQQDQYMSDKQLRCKGDLNFLHDTLLEGGKLDTLNNGPGYREEREYHTDYHLVKFYFVTRCYYSYVERILAFIKNQCIQPDIFILNSCVWDISRYGVNGVAKYKENLKKLVQKLKSTLPVECLVIWNTTLPISSEAKGGFLVPEVEFMTNALHLDILQANRFAQQIMSEAGFDVLDLHYHLRNHIHRRAEDGIHWDMTAHRRITNLLLTHISEAWNKDLPRNVDEYITAKTSSWLESMVDDQTNNNMPLPAHIANRPKAKARRRRQRSKKGSPVLPDPIAILPNPIMNNSNHFPKDSFHMNGFQNGEVFRSPANVNLPAMVNPLERYGGPVGSSQYHGSPSPLRMLNSNAAWQQISSEARRHLMGNNETLMSPYQRQANIMNQQRLRVSPHHLLPPKCLQHQFW